MPRKPKKPKLDSPAAVPASSDLISGVFKGSDLPTREEKLIALEMEPLAELAPPEREIVESPKPIRGAHTQAILEGRPTYRAISDQYQRIASFEREGIRLFKDTIIRNGHKIGVTAVQFSDRHPPDRAEKDLLEALGDPDWQRKAFTYDGAVWKRYGTPGDALGDNAIDAYRVAEQIAGGRRGRGV